MPSRSVDAKPLTLNRAVGLWSRSGNFTLRHYQAPLLFAAKRSSIRLATPSVHLLPLPKVGTAERRAEAPARAEHDKEHVVLVRDGEPVAAVVPLEDLEPLGAEDGYWSRRRTGLSPNGRPQAGQLAFRLRISRAIWTST
jgi:hypothetical protein